MARYISEDEFIAWVKEHYCSDCNNDNGLRCRACWIDDAIDLVEEAPSADVVPKSELSIIGVQNMALENTNVDLQRRLVIAEAVASVAIGKASDMVSESKREVAREIFEEIDNILNDDEIDRDLSHDEFRGASVALERVGGKIAKLKKKHTEDQT